MISICSWRPFYSSPDGKGGDSIFLFCFVFPAAMEFTLWDRVVFQIPRLHVLGFDCICGKGIGDSGAKDYKRFDLCCAECSLCY